MSVHLWYHTRLLSEEGVFTQPCSISYGITLWLKRNAHHLLHITCYWLFFTIFSSLYWLSLGFSMASSRGSCRESCPSFLNSYKSPAQGLAMLKSRHIPAFEIRRFGLNFYPQKRWPLLLGIQNKNTLDLILDTLQFTIHLLFFFT